MRLSVRTDDPGYSERAYDAGVKVFVDGVEVRACFTADEELGVAFCYETDDDGKILVDRENDSCKDVQFHGNVKIVLPGRDK